MDSQGLDMFVGVLFSTNYLFRVQGQKRLENYSVSLLQMQRRPDWGGRSGREGCRSGADYEPSIDRCSGELVRGRRQRWVSPERSVRDRSPHEGREYRRGSEGYDYARNVSRLHSHGDRDYRDQGYSESRFGRDCDYRDQGYNESCFGRDRDYRRDCDYRDRYSDLYGERRYASGRLERFNMRGETTKEEDRKVVSILNDMFDWVKPEIVDASVNHPLNRRRPFDKALLLQRCMEDLENCRTWRFQSHEVSQESKSSYVREPSVVIPNSLRESKSSRVKEPSTDIPEVSKDTSVKAKIVTSTPEASTVRMEVNEKSNLSDSSAVNKQSSKPVVGSVMYPKKRCFLKGCEMHVTHLRRHLLGRHLPPCSALKDEMPLAMQMSQFNNILLSIANNVGCNNVFDLLEVVMCRRWYPDGEPYFLTDDDVQVMRDFVKWVTGKEMRTKPTLNPPNTIGVLTHWRLLGILISRVGEKNVTWYRPDQPSSTEKRKQERDSFAVSVDARQPTEVEIEVDVGEEVQMGLAEPVSESKSGVESTPKVVINECSSDESSVVSDKVQSGVLSTPKNDVNESSCDGSSKGVSVESSTVSSIKQAQPGHARPKSTQDGPMPSVPVDLVSGVVNYCHGVPVKAGLDALRQAKGLHFAFGVHPKLAHRVTMELNAMKSLILTDGRCRGIGEIGVDLSGNFARHLKDQVGVLRSFLELYVSKQLWSMVIVIHCRSWGHSMDGSEQCLRAMGRELPSTSRQHYKVHRHCFNGGLRGGTCGCKSFLK